jgi:hypothetical protein
MSRYLKQTGLPFRDRDCLVEALRGIGHLVVVYETPQHLAGYAGDMRPETAEIILPRLSLTSASNDIGFAYEDGLWTAIVSEYDQRSRYGDAWQRQLKVMYQRKLVEKTARRLGMSPAGEVGYLERGGQRRLQIRFQERRSR